MARAKRTDRADARRRHRATFQTADVTGDGQPEGGVDEERARDAAPAPLPRPGIRSAFSGAFRPLDLRGDLQSLPMLLRSRALLVPLALTLLATAIPIVGGLTTLTVLPAQFFIVPPPVGGAFIAGFLAPRASWVAGLLIGIVASFCFGILVAALSDTSQVSTVESLTPLSATVNALAISPASGALFAAAAAWYKRFLDLANPNRGRRPPAARPRSSGRSSARPFLSRANARRR